MPRTVTITVPPHLRDALVADLEAVEGVLGLRVSPGISLKPPRDLVPVDITNRKVPHLVKLIERHHVVREGGSISTSEPLSFISSSSARFVPRDVNDSTWEEMEMMLANESNMHGNGMLLMFVAGLTAAVGLATGAIHVVIAGMVIGGVGRSAGQRRVDARRTGLVALANRRGVGGGWRVIGVCLEAEAAAETAVGGLNLPAPLTPPLAN